MKIKFLFTIMLSLTLVAGLPQGRAQNRLDFSGTYNVRGTNPDGTTYAGTMIISAYGDGYRVTQTYSDGTVFRGIGNDMGIYLTVAYLSGNLPSISIYKVTQPNMLEGFWQDYDNQKEGSETAVVLAGGSFPVSPSVTGSARFDYSGTYSVQGTNPDGTSYTGTMLVATFGDGYRVTQTYSDGTVWRGVGNDIANYFVVAYQTNDGPSVQIYQRDRSGTLAGYWQNYSNLREGTETAVRR